MKSILLMLLIAVQTSFAGWVEIWSDEFSWAGLPDSSRWTYEDGYIRNSDAPFYTRARSLNGRIENGNLIIESRRDFWNGKQYTYASLTTKNKMEFTYGRIEVRAEIPTGRGTWCAINLMPD
jgi:beta-glucanase (GH16 family)